jgi:hypothetical protein
MRWSDAYGADFISATPRAAVLLRQIGEQPQPARKPLHIHIHGAGLVRDAASRQRARTRDLGGEGSIEGGLPMATKNQETEPTEAGFDDNGDDPTPHAMSPGGHYAVAHSDGDSLTLKRDDTTSDSPFGAVDPPGTKQTEGSRLASPRPGARGRASRRCSTAPGRAEGGMGRDRRPTEGLANMAVIIPATGASILLAIDYITTGGGQTASSDPSTPPIPPGRARLRNPPWNSGPLRCRPAASLWRWCSYV